jgi:hypothetical protein
MNSQAIEIKGIVRNQTKIGVQDGQCDDIVNLRFKDGSLRVADDGKSVYNMTEVYSQLYVHTNVYHHLLGVKNDKLWWFANIEEDGETFANLDNPIEICDVQGDVTIVQNGHLLTIIGHGKSAINYAIFKSGSNEYKELKMNPNGEQMDRDLYPFGSIHLNLNCDYNSSREYIVEDTSGVNGSILLDDSDINYNDSGALVPAYNDEKAEKTLAAKQLWHSQMLAAFRKAKEDNALTRPVLALVAVKMYDGSYMYASAPILLNPRERLTKYKSAIIGDNNEESTEVEDIFFQRHGAKIGSSTEEWVSVGNDIKFTSYKAEVADLCHSSAGKYSTNKLPIYISGAASVKYRNALNTFQPADYAIKFKMTSCVYGSSLIMTLGDITPIIENSDVFAGVSIFITKEVDIYKMGADDYKDGHIKVDAGNNEGSGYNDGSKEGVTVWGNLMYKPSVRPDSDVIYDLINSPFYLLREYNINELKSMNNTTIEVDLSRTEYKGLLANIEQQPILNAESLDRKDFFPQTAYQYNQKLHIANYRTTQYHGFPIDCFHLNNHNLIISNGEFAINGTLANVKEGLDTQYHRSKYQFLSGGSKDIYDQYIQASKDRGYCFASIRVLIDAQQGEKQVVRYIIPYDSYNFKNGDNANFVESLGALLTYPDNRASEMEIAVIVFSGNIYRKSATFKLTSHPYLNVAYYIDPELRPISLPSIDGISLNQFLEGQEPQLFKTPLEKNTTESFPNGLKVSSVNNPFFFPYETTYQVGSSEIVALMSNAVAVGTGQTGAAPLYVFCKDGIYSLMVDSSGEMAYTNARIIARDVCNNAKSVTPIDNGVVFTTDRGLMSIAGSEVIEIGSAAEGDVFDITDAADKAKKIMFNSFSMHQLAEFPQTLVDNTDFLTYLKGAIVNYNHNERELMVSNPDKGYTYVMDRNGNWSRRAFTAQEYVNNYPTSYRLDEVGNFYKVDADDNDTNQVYLLSNVIKLGTINFKKAELLVVRGYFEVINNIKTILNKSFQKYYNVDEKGYYHQVIEEYNATHSGEYEFKLSKIKSISTFVKIEDEISLNENNKFYIRITDKDGNILISTNQIVGVGDVSLKLTLSKPTILQIELVGIGDFLGREPYFYNTTTISCEDITIIPTDKNKLGLYVFGSYDGRQWSLLGRNEKDGKFTDIGCKVSHTDIKFMRICIAGKISHASRIDFVEIEYDGSNLNTKLR